MNAISREKEADIRKLYERYASMVFRRCRMFFSSEDDAMDATQEVFMKLIRSIDSVNKKESIYSWLLSTATNYCISQLRKKSPEAFDEESYVSDSHDTLPQDQRLLLNDIISHFISPLDEKMRLVVIYSFIDGYRQDEVAKLTGMGESTVRRYLTRFRRRNASLSLERKDLV